MARTDRRHPLLPAAALLCGLAAAGGASAAAVGSTETTQFLPVWLATADAAPLREVPALLNMPPGWITGDAAVVLAPGGDWAPGQRDRLVWVLLDAGAAVLEINPPRPGQQDLAEEMVGALGTLRVGFGAGVVVAIGHGAAGDAALAAGATAQAPDGWGYAAAVRLGLDAVSVRFGATPEAEDWRARAGMLCDLLAVAQTYGAPDIAGACHGDLARLR